MNEKTFKEYDTKFSELLNPYVCKWLRKENITPEDLRALYFGDGPICSERALAYADFSSDIQFICGIHEVLKVQSSKKQTQTYVYKFCHDPGTSFLRTVMNIEASGDNFMLYFKEKLRIIQLINRIFHTLALGTEESPRL